MYYQVRCKKNKTMNQLYSFANNLIYFSNKLPNQINNNSEKYFKSKLDGFKKNGKYN